MAGTKQEQATTNGVVPALVYLTGVLERIEQEVMTARIAADLMMGNQHLDIDYVVELARKIMVMVRAQAAVAKEHEDAEEEAKR